MTKILIMSLIMLGSFVCVCVCACACSCACACVCVCDVCVAGSIENWNATCPRNKRIEVGDYIVGITAGNATPSKHGADLDEASGLGKLQGLLHEELLERIEEAPRYEVPASFSNCHNTLRAIHRPFACICALSNLLCFSR